MALGGSSVALVAGAAKAAGAPIVLRFGSGQPLGHANIRAMEMFRDELSKLSGGQFKVEVYPAGQLGGITEGMEATQVGTQQMQVGTPATVAPIVKEMDVMSLLFLAGSEEKVFAAVDGEFGRRLGAAAEKAGLQPLAWWAAGSRNFLTNKHPISTPDDLKGLKIRVIGSPVWIKSMAALGANAVSMDYSQIYSALQSNVIDGYENLFTDVDKSGMFQVVKYLSMSSHLFDVFTVYVNKKLFDGFTPEQQKMVAQAMRTATDWQRKAQAADSQKSLEKLRGVMQVSQVSDANRKLFADKVQPVYAEFEKTLGKDLIEQAIKAMR
ncbi:MAG TPA: TRAP transporter substrate-binding protein [Candidatus Acidoferrum sp.]|nr:TRAP transporter substrate-binding protein [Candidatus Acidoferrum sp.]